MHRASLAFLSLRIACRNGGSGAMALQTKILQKVAECRVAVALRKAGRRAVRPREKRRARDRTYTPPAGYSFVGKSSKRKTENEYVCTATFPHRTPPLKHYKNAWAIMIIVACRCSIDLPADLNQKRGNPQELCNPLLTLWLRVSYVSV